MQVHVWFKKHLCALADKFARRVQDVKSRPPAAKADASLTFPTANQTLSPGQTFCHAVDVSAYILKYISDLGRLAGVHPANHRRTSKTEVFLRDNAIDMT